MGRRRDRIEREDYSSDSGGSEEEDEGLDVYGEFESFTQPSRRKKQRRGKRSKDEVMLGIFAEESDDERDLMRKNIRYKGVDFVEKDAGDEVTMAMQTDDNDDNDDHDGEGRPRLGIGGASMRQTGLGLQQEAATSEEPEEKAEQEEDYRPTFGLGPRMLGGGSKSGRGLGLGFRPAQPPEPQERPSEQEDDYRPSFGTSRKHGPEPPLSETFAHHTTTQSDTMHTALPTAPKPSFLAAATSKGTSTPTSRKYGLGASMLEKMGYREGQGLGSEGQGILNPIETKLRPERMGLGGVREMTAQAREEARRRGQILSDDEDEKKVRRRKKGAEGGGSGTSTPRSRAKKVVYQTVEEMAGGMAVPATIQKLVDLQGREVDLASAVSGVGKMEDDLRIAQLARRDLKRFGDEFKALEQQKKYIHLERTRVHDELALDEQNIALVESIVMAVEKLSITASSGGTGIEGLEAINAEIMELQRDVPKESIFSLGLDEVVVGIIHPMVKQVIVDWDPLSDPNANGLTTTLKSWNQILLIRTKHQQDLEIEAESGLFPHQNKLLTHPPQKHSKLTHNRVSPYESLIYHIILPKVRSAINNLWSPYDPAPATALLDSWDALLPQFIHANLLDQIVLPKLRRAIDKWNPRKSSHETVHLWIFPWLPYLEHTHREDLINTIQYKFKTLLETWDLKHGAVPGLEEWRELFGRGALEDILLKTILPKLALELRENLEIDPADQQLDVLLERVMVWRPYFRGSTWGQLLQSEFFSKWVGLLYLWLTSEMVDMEEVSQWYEWWKHSVFPPEVLELDGVRRGFKAGLDLMSKAADYIENNIPLSKLPAPISTGPQRPVSKPVKVHKKEDSKAKGIAAAPAKEKTIFKDILEEVCVENSLLMVPLRRADEASGKALFRVTASADGKGGVMGYIGEGDVLWLQTKRQGAFEPVGLDRLVPLAERR